MNTIGNVSTARDSHGAALVGDNMYVYGGQDTSGAALDDIRALHIPERKWYVFRSMGPVPQPRTGHAMTSVGTRVVVCGGHSSDGFVQCEDQSTIHIMETSGLNFPARTVPSSNGSSDA